MDPALILILAGLFAMIALPFVATGLVITTRQLIRTQAKLDRQPSLTLASRTRKPDDFPPGTVPAELGELVLAAWRAEGYGIVGDRMVALRMVSIAHRVICSGPVSSLAPAHFNDGDRMPPAKVACRSHHTGECTFPACACEAIPEPLPPVPEKSS